MPEIIPLGWFHTFVGIFALIAGMFTLLKYKEILLETRSGKYYLIATLITASTALAIFQHGVFGPAHILGVMTLLALLVGTIAAITSLFGKFSRYLQALSYSATLLFHCIPAVTDALLRLPVGEPLLKSIQHPVMIMSHLALVVLFIVAVTVQLRWVHKNPRVI